MNHDKWERRGLGSAVARARMKTPVLIVLTVIALGTGGVLAIMNNACKSSHHAWCAPNSEIRHHTKVGQS